jgi:NarL family two-component system response regulator LiaR
MKRHVLIYGIAAGALIAALNLIQYRYLVVEHSVEIYGGLVAAIFSAVGIWLGLRITARRQPRATGASPDQVAGYGEDSSPSNQGRPFQPDERCREGLRITPRELEILNLIAHGMSNREIAERLFVSENTVKTHSSRVFDKLGAKRRTQAVQLGKELGLLP